MNAGGQVGIEKNSEAGYRRGFIDGADSTITGLWPRLTDEDVRLLRTWMRDLLNWRQSSAGEPRLVPVLPRLEPPRPVDPRP